MCDGVAWCSETNHVVEWSGLLRLTLCGRGPVYLGRPHGGVVWPAEAKCVEMIQSAEVKCAVGGPVC